jgi:hypothetical protein
MPTVSEIESVTLTAELQPETADREIARAVSARHKIARRYVLRLRSRNPEASPAEIVATLERHYIRAITIAGGVVTAGTIAANVGIALIPGVAAGKEAGKGAARVAAKGAARTVATKAAAAATAKSAVKGAAKSAARTGAERAVQLLPAGDEQLQFEITAVFALAMAEVHSMSLDQEQAHALVYGLSNGRVSQQQIAVMATDLANASDPVGGVGHTIVSGRDDWSHWANTLADTLPGGVAQDLVRTVQTGKLETVRASLSGKQQSVVEYGAGAIAGGATRFLFGSEVVEASRIAFAAPPEEFPEHLSDALLARTEEQHEANRALVALEDAAKTTGSWVTSAAGKSTRAFRSVDLDGDGIPDEPQALTAVKGVGGSVAGAVATGTRAFRSVDIDGDGIPDQPQVFAALKGARAGVTSRLRRKSVDDAAAPTDAEHEPIEHTAD